MAKKEESSEQAEKPESEIPAEQNVGAEQPVSTDEAESVQQGQVSEEISKDSQMWAMICHLAGLAGLIMPAIGNIAAPLVVWQIKKDDDPFIDEQGKEAVNFQISMTIYGFVSAVLIPVFCTGFFLLATVYVIDLIFLLIAAVKANNGYHYRYPLTIRFIK